MSEETEGKKNEQKHGMTPLSAMKMAESFKKHIAEVKAGRVYNTETPDNGDSTEPNGNIIIKNGNRPVDSVITAAHSENEPSNNTGNTAERAKMDGDSINGEIAYVPETVGNGDSSNTDATPVVDGIVPNDHTGDNTTTETNGESTTADQQYTVTDNATMPDTNGSNQNSNDDLVTDRIFRVPTPRDIRGNHRKQVRVAVVVDYENVYRLAYKAFGDTDKPRWTSSINPIRYAELACNVYSCNASLKKVVVCRGLPDRKTEPIANKRNLLQCGYWNEYASSHSISFEMRFEPLQYSEDKDGRVHVTEKGVDTQCVVQVIDLATSGQYDVVLIASQDTDFGPAISYASDWCNIVQVRWQSSSRWTPAPIFHGGRVMPSLNMGWLDYKRSIDHNDYSNTALGYPNVHGETASDNIHVACEDEVETNGSTDDIQDTITHDNGLNENGIGMTVPVNNADNDSSDDSNTVVTSTGDNADIDANAGQSEAEVDDEIAVELSKEERELSES